jgi:hypothetical protein
MRGKQEENERNGLGTKSRAAKWRRLHHLWGIITSFPAK